MLQIILSIQIVMVTVIFSLLTVSILLKRKKNLFWKFKHRNKIYSVTNLLVELLVLIDQRNVVDIVYLVCTKFFDGLLHKILNKKVKWDPNLSLSQNRLSNKSQRMLINGSILVEGSIQQTCTEICLGLVLFNINIGSRNTYQICRRIWVSCQL